MGSNLNFRNLGNDPTVEGGRPLAGGIPLARQGSIYSLTFDEFQNAVGGSGKDYGSMNMDELLKNIWNAEENHNFGSSSGSGAAMASGQEGGGGHLQRQGSLTLPRTLSHKTVDEVWRNMAKEYGGGKDVGGGIGSFGVPQAQPTLGEITIEEFLMRAGVVREENLGYFGNLSNGSRIGYGFQQQGGQNAELLSGGSDHIAVQSAVNLPLSVNGSTIRSAGQTVDDRLPKRQQQPQQQQQQQQQQQHILPKQPALAYGSSVCSPRITGEAGGISNPAMSNALNVQTATLQDGGLGMVGLGANGVTVATGSPALSSDGFAKSNGDLSSVSPVPYLFNGATRGRRHATLEKAVERRQRRMIKNRESAARSRARKQAYTMELEAEVAKLKEEQEVLQKKLAEIIETQKNQALEMVKHQKAAKRQCLRRTQTGPW